MCCKYQYLMCGPIYLYSLHGYCRDPVNVFEGQEKQAFWDAIGGKCEYHSDKRLQVRYIMCFQICTAVGEFTRKSQYR